MTVFRGELIAAGDFELAGGTRVNHVARWDGSRWRPMGEGFNGQVNTVVVFKDKLIVGWQFTGFLGPVASWDGSAWSALGTPASGLVAHLNVNALYVDGETLVAGGTFDRMGEVPVSRIARWDRTFMESDRRRIR